jgi:hypothetical protein
MKRVFQLKQELESRMKRTDLQWEWKEVIRWLDALQQVEVNLQADAFYSAASLRRMLGKPCVLPAWAISPTLWELQ